MSRSTTFGTSALLFAVACAWRGTPVPVAGDVARLTGRWEGSYSSAETGRSGSISFQLVAGTDSAFGDVLMIPAQVQGTVGAGMQPRTSPAVVSPRPLRITFVRAEGDLVRGTLDVYQDPETEEPLLTKFEGRLHGDGIKGTYSTFATRSRQMLTGEWSVKRKQG
jgi:hypothetical protein